MVTVEETGHKPPELRYKKNAYAQSKNLVLPRQYFTALFCAPRGVGKSFSACQLIKSYELDPPVNDDGTKQDIRTILISPTADQNECFTALKSLDKDDIHRSYSDSVLEDILEDIKAKEKEIEDYREKLKIYKKFQKIRDINKLSDEELLFLNDNEFEEPEKPKHANGISNFLIIDDMVGSSIFKASGRSPFTNLLLRNRHHRINIIIMTQHLKAIPASIRNNISVYWVGKFGSKSILPILYEEIGSGLLTEDQFNEFYELATSQPFGSLVVDFTQPKDKRFSNNFISYIKL